MAFYSRVIFFFMSYWSFNDGLSDAAPAQAEAFPQVRVLCQSLLINNVNTYIG